jgi:putative molybdopterin biosynthesis protein
MDSIKKETVAVFKDLPDLLTAEEACDFLRITPLTLYTYIKQGKLPAYRVGKRYRITKESIVSFLERGSPNPPETAPMPSPEEKPAKAEAAQPVGEDAKKKIDELFGTKKK